MPELQQAVVRRDAVDAVDTLEAGVQEFVGERPLPGTNTTRPPSIYAR